MGTPEWAEVETALRARRQRLIEQGLAREQEGQLRSAQDLPRTLEARELAHVASEISARTGLEHLEVRAGDNLTGFNRGAQQRTVTSRWRLGGRL